MKRDATNKGDLTVTHTAFNSIYSLYGCGVIVCIGMHRLFPIVSEQSATGTEWDGMERDAEGCDGMRLSATKTERNLVIVITERNTNVKKRYYKNLIDCHFRESDKKRHITEYQ